MEAQKRKFMVVATEPTPNPAALKFNLNTKAIAHGGRSFNNDIEAEGDPFAETMFSFGVVTALLIQDRFVSVTLNSAEEWDLLDRPHHPDYRGVAGLLRQWQKKQGKRRKPSWTK